MKEQIDKAFHNRYRLRPIEPEISPSISITTHFQQEQYHTPSQRWIPCSENKQHVLRFLMQWVLVRSPLARMSSFDLYRSLFDDEYSHPTFHPYFPYLQRQVVFESGKENL